MSKEKERFAKYCVYCRARVFEGQVYCDNCGKLIVRIKSDNEKPKIKEKPLSPLKHDISRKCSGCGSVITSTVLKQCPICDTVLEELPEHIKTLEKKPRSAGFVFTNKKLEPEKKYLIKKDSWNFKEGMNVFVNCLTIYIFIQFLIYMLLFVQIDPNAPSGLELNIFNIIISQIPGITFGLYAIGYIIVKKHKVEKLGFDSSKDKLLTAGLIGLVGGFILIGINFLSTNLNQIFENLGLSIINITEYNSEQYMIIAQAHPLWIILLGILLCLSAISSEIVIRGVLHNTLKSRFEDNLRNKLLIITITGLIYGTIYLIVSLGVGITFFILNFLIGFILGLLYEINRNIYNTLVASCVYNIIFLILIIFS